MAEALELEVQGQPIGVTRFFVRGRAVTKGSFHVRHRWGPMKNGKPTCAFGLQEMGGEGLTEIRKLIATAARRQKVRYEGPVNVGVTIFFPSPRPKLKGKPAGHRRRFDPDKLARLVLDALTDAGIYEDDGMVATLLVQKRFCTGDEVPGYFITLEEA